MMENLIIRPMKGDDYLRIAEIDKKLLGRERKRYWKLKTEILEKRSPSLSLVAEVDGKVVGFIIGDLAGWGYTVPEDIDIGFIDTLGVDPEYQRRGIGKVLFNEIVERMKKLGVKTIYTFVDWRNWELIRFFDGLGFEKGDMINLKLRLF